jgi:hypothetical protein
VKNDRLARSMFVPGGGAKLMRRAEADTVIIGEDGEIVPPAR